MTKKQRQLLRKKVGFALLMVLLLVGSFCWGRAYGWAEADKFMADLAMALSQTAPPARAFNCPSPEEQ